MSKQLLIKEAGRITLTSAPHPFKTASQTVFVEEGMTLEEMLESCQPDQMLRHHAVAMINGHIIPREVWRVVRPKAGTLVEIRVVARGFLLRAILALVVIAAVVIFAPYLAPVLGVELATAGAIISAVGMLAISVLAPIKPPKLQSEEREPSYSISGSRNRLTPFAPVPQVLGRHRFAPPLGAGTFTEIIGGDQYLILLFVWGIGPVVIDIASLKIGETLLSDFEDVETEHREGLPGDTPLTLYPDTVVQTNPSLLLTDANFRQRTTAVNADEISVDINFPVGLTNIKLSTGKPGSITVIVEINFRKVGDSTWLTPTFTAKTVPDSWISGDTITFTQKTRTPFRHGFRWSTATRDQYEVRVRRTTVPSGNVDHIEDTYFQVLRTITNEDPIRSSVPVAKTVLRIKATDQLNRTIDDFNGICTTKGLDWNGSSWDADQEITNPASLYRHVLQGKAIASPLIDARLDLTGIEAFHLHCSSKGFKFNQVRFDATSVWDTLRDIAGAGRAAPSQPDGKWGVVIEEVRANPTSHITPRNSFGFSAVKPLFELPHALRIPFPNEDQGFRNDERRVYLDGFTVANATRFERMQIPGVTDPEQIHKIGRFRIAQFINQPEQWSFGQDVEYITYERGSHVLITHDVLLVGLGSGRVKSVTVDGSDNVTALRLDEEITMVAGTDYGISIRTVPDPEVTRQVVTVAETTRDITLTTSIPPVSGEPAIAKGDIFGFGELGSETDDATIISIKPNTEHGANIVAVPYRPVIYDIDGEAIPAFTSNLTPLPVITAPRIISTVSDETAIIFGPGQSLQTRVIITFDPLDDPRLDDPHVRVQFRPTETGERFRSAPVQEESPSYVALSGFIDGETVDLRLRFEVAGRLPGPWATIFNHTVVGKLTQPGALVGLTISVFGGQAMLRWDQPAEIDVIYGGEVRFRHSPLLTGATWPASSSIGQTARARDLIASLPLKAGTYLARVFDSSGNRSDGIATVATKQASVLTFTSEASVDEDPGYGGTHTDTVVISSILKLDNDAGAVRPIGTYDFVGSFDLTTVKRVRLSSRLTMTSTNVDDLIDSRTTLIDTWQSFDGADQAVTDARVETRHTDDDPGGSPTWTAWERLDSAEFEARGFEFRAILTSDDPTFNVLVTALGIDAEVLA